MKQEKRTILLRPNEFLRYAEKLERQFRGNCPIGHNDNPEIEACQKELDKYLNSNIAYLNRTL